MKPDPIRLTIEGMTCDHCAVAIRDALKKVDGVRDAVVSYGSKTAVVDVEPPARADELLQAVARAGRYEARVQEPAVPSTMIRAAERMHVRVEAGVRIVGVAGGPGAYEITVEAGNRIETILGDALLVATGRRPNTASLGLAEANIRTNERGAIVVDEHQKTSNPDVYAAGDVTGDPMFVYVSAHTGSVAAENALFGDRVRRDLRGMPHVTFTDPAVASVGMTEDEARESGADIVVSKLGLEHVPRAIAARDTRGFVKLVVDAKTRLLLGAHVLAPEAGEMIQECVMAIRHGITVDDIARAMHPYLTHAEGIKLAAQSLGKDVSKLSCCAA